ncbi:Uma2 family endonuclease [Kovacikia minuta CCNUW1]|uniref:Uma2 family endonuclease n=1 Tax=Kovacikia minuta TaxID=2931930 RepID=UPI001CCDF66D|nr:Uma2 family endonuclease [Kovacikia minuta]UBF26472.1 Uma2 family endonuclease [Kovacikia minuta CCNUW1]
MIVTSKLYSLPEFLQLPQIEESPAWELIEGQIVQKPMPTIHHSILQKRLVAAIDPAGSDYEAFPELRCVLSSNSVVPDITIVRRNRIPTENVPIAGAPDWMIEILSPDQSVTKLIEKIQNCLKEGTQLGWLIDSTEQVIMVLFPDQRINLLKESDRLPVPPGVLLHLTVEQVLGWVQSPSQP